MSALDRQIGGNHYKSYKIQPWEFIEKNGLGFTEGNIIKYICRYKQKGGKQDLEKLKHYVDMLIELYYPDDNDNENTNIKKQCEHGKNCFLKTFVNGLLGKEVFVRLKDGSIIRGCLACLDQGSIVIELGFIKHNINLNNIDELTVYMGD